MKAICTAVCAVLALALTSCGVSRNENAYNIVGYVAGYRQFDISTIDATRLTHINFAFANVIDGRVVFDTAKIDGRVLDPGDIAKLNALKAKNPGLKVLVSVGGWGWSGNFSDAALTDSSRRIFGSSAALFIKKYGIDGIDIDWEYPNQPGAGNIHRPADKENFTLLLAAVRESIDSLAAASGREDPYLLTIATGGDSAYIANTSLGEAVRYLDFINIMSYDLHNGLTSQAGHHANLKLSACDSPHGDAVERAVQMHLAAGVPPDKINIGVPFYGRIWRGVEPVDNGLYRQARTTGWSIPYSEVTAALSDPRFRRYYDSSASAPFLWNSADSVFISFDDETSIEAKMKWLKEKGLAGVMFWEYAEDTDGRLLGAVVRGLRGEQ